MMAETVASEPAANETPAPAPVTGEPTTPDTTLEAEATTVAETPAAEADPAIETTDTAPAETETAPSVDDLPDEVVTEKLKEIAARENLTIDGNKVVERERANFREWQRKQRDQLQSEEAAALAEVEAAEAQYQSEIEQIQALRQAKKSGKLDPETFARAVGRGNWEEVLQIRMAQLADPLYREKLDLEQERAAQAQRNEQARREHARRLEMQKAFEADRAHLRSLSDNLAESTDLICKLRARDVRLVSAIAGIQQQLGLATPEDAIRAKIDGFSIADGLKDMCERSLRAKARAKAAQPTAAAPSPPRKAPPKTNRTQVVKGPAVEPAHTGDWATDKDFIKYGIEKLKLAIDTERADRAKGR